MNKFIEIFNQNKIIRLQLGQRFANACCTAPLGEHIVHTRYELAPSGEYEYSTVTTLRMC